MSEPRAIFSLDIPIRFSGSLSGLLEHAARLGRREGRDHDWFPQSFDDAIFEILLFDPEPERHGITFLAARESSRKDVFRYRIDLHFDTEGEVRIREIFDDQDGDVRDLLIRGLRYAAPPVDLGFEIAEQIEPSAHQRMAALHAAGMAGLTLDYLGTRRLTQSGARP